MENTNEILIKNESLENTGAIEVKKAWYVGAFKGNEDLTDKFFTEKRWEYFGNKDTVMNDIKSMQVGERIALKSSFPDNGKKTTTVYIKAIGFISNNPGDGKNLSIHWEQRFEPVKKIHGTGSIASTVVEIQAIKGKKGTKILNFTFNKPTEETLDLREDDNNTSDTEIDKASNNSMQSEKPPIHSLNTILYGAPGTGKTYSTAEYAVAIVENRSIDLNQKSDTQRKELMDTYREHIESGRIVFTTFHQNYGYEDFIEGLRPNPEGQNLTFEYVDGVFKKIVEDAIKNTNKNYVIIIDEINRANISKVFGELITLIEKDKRYGELNEITAMLPSGDTFVVPNNLYILGTMNSADKSISLIDTALRRRFEFIEVVPNYSTITDLNLRGVLESLNESLYEEFKSPDLLIGHAYFINENIDKLCDIMNRAIIPLLYEYCFDNAKNVKKILEKAIHTITDRSFVILDSKISRIKIKPAEE